jgi:hypothetical protein
MNATKITQKVYEGAIGQIRQQVVEGSIEEAAERSASRVAQTNANLANVFVGPNKLAVKTFEVDELRLRSRPQFVIVDGRIKWRNASDQVGAETPKPWRFATVASGVSADLHLASVLTNLVRGYFQGEKVKTITNLMVVTRKVAPGTPAKEGVTVSENVDFAKFVAATNEARAANDPKVQALRVKKPGQSPEFSVDRNGALVAIVHDFSLEVPAPEAAAKGGLTGPPARIYRIEAPAAEFAISFQVAPAQNDQPIRLKGKVEGFDAGPGAKVFAINDDEAKAQQLSALTAQIVLAGFRGKIQGQPIDVPLADLNIPGFTLNSVSPVDPSGWMRVILTPIPR